MSSILFATGDGKEVCCQPCGDDCIDYNKYKNKMRRKHYHCPKCLKIVTRALNFKIHIKNCFELAPELSVHNNQGIKEMSKTTGKRLSSCAAPQKDKHVFEGLTTYACKHCGKTYQYASSMRDHIQKHHSPNPRLLPCLCVDNRNGIFAVARAKTGLLAPIHVQKCSAQQLFSCTMADCQDVMRVSAVINPGIECEHLKAVQNAHTPVIKCLHLEYLEKLVDIRLISTNRLNLCKNLLEASFNERVPLVVYLNFEDLGYSNRTSYYSVYTNEDSYYCRLKRTRVSFDKCTAIWSCQCPCSNSTISCTHEAVVKWFMCEHQPLLFSQNKQRLTIGCLTDKDTLMMNYYLKQKLIPAIVPEHLKQEVHPSSPLVASESICPFCSGPLVESKKKCATIYGFGSTWPGIFIVGKYCETCTLHFRFQNYQSGFHNYDNSVFLTLKLCLHLTLGIQFSELQAACQLFESCRITYFELFPKIYNSNSKETRIVSAKLQRARNLKVLFPDENVPINVIRNGLYHFLALQDVNYAFTCNRCGFYPKVIVGDGNWRNTCLRPVECLKKDDNEESINADEAWLSYRKEIIGRGFFGTTRNPWKVSISYDTNAPWMGPTTRRNEWLLNTEFEKAATLQRAKPQTNILGDKSHEDIMQALYSPQTTTSNDLKQMCSSFGITERGSTDDMINDLLELILFKDLFPKCYKSIKRCGGGIVHLRCVHGVCVYMKCLLRQESARDYVDGLLSFSKQPRVIVSDIASQIALHGEHRSKGMFRPFKGMLYEWNNENLRKEKEGRLEKVVIDLSEDDDSSFFSLSDSFHNSSKKKGPNTTFRCIKNSNLFVNTSVCEQKNSEMARDSLKSLMTSLPLNLRVSNVTRSSSALRLGDLSGNRFTVTLRNLKTAPDICGDTSLQVDNTLHDSAPQQSSLQDTVEKSLSFVEKHGFVNYFGPQRFGRECSESQRLVIAESNLLPALDDNTILYEASTIGLALLNRDMKAAVNLLLCPSSDDADGLSEAAKRYFRETGDIAGTIKRMPARKERELCVLRALRKFASNVNEFERTKSNTGEKTPRMDTLSDGYIIEAYTRALQSMPHAALLFFCRAYCSHIWNEAVTQRLRQFGNKVVEGDVLICGKEKEVKVVSKSDVTHDVYTLHDVVLPLPGNNMNLPSNMQDFFLNALRRDKVLSSACSLEGAFHVNELKLKVSGSYRKIIGTVNNLKFVWDYPRKINSGQLSSNTAAQVHDHVSKPIVGGSKPNGESRTLTLTFDLPPSTYATTLLEQISKNGIKKHTIGRL